MNIAFSRELEVEMSDIENMFEKSLQPWWSDLTNLVSKINKDHSFQLMPAVVILAYRCLDMDHDIRVAMGNLFKTLYFANRIHSLVSDSDEGQIHNQDMQFTILIGDYIFGRVLKLLLEAGADQTLDDFARMISEVNEGLVIKHKMKESMQEILIKTSVPFYATAFLTAAKLKGLEQADLILYEEIGFNLGAALEFSLAGYNQDAIDYLDRTYKSIDKFKSATANTNSCLDKYLQELQSMVLAFETEAVV